MNRLPKELRKRICFRPTNKSLDLECATFLQKNLKEKKQLNDWINHACQFYYDYEFRKRGFIQRLIREHFDFCKHILRRVGRIIKNNNY